MEQEVIFDLNKYMNSLSMESYDPREYVLNSEVYSTEAIFTRHWTEEEYKSKKAKLNEVAGKIYDTIANKINFIKKELENQSDRKGGNTAQVAKMITIISKNQFTTMLNDIVTGKSKEKFVPVATCTKLRSGNDAMTEGSGWRGIMNYLTKETAIVAANSFSSVFWSAIFDRDEMKSFFKQKDKDTRKAANLINIGIRREKGNWISKIFLNPIMDDNAAYILTVTPKYRIKQDK